MGFLDLLVIWLTQDTLDLLNAGNMIMVILREPILT